MTGKEELGLVVELYAATNPSRIEVIRLVIDLAAINDWEDGWHEITSVASAELFDDLWSEEDRWAEARDELESELRYRRITVL